MTTPSPRGVWYEREIELFHPITGFYSLPVESFVPSIDMDRVPFCQARLELGRVLPETWAALDSRAALKPRVMFRLHQKAYDAAGEEYTVASLPRVAFGTENQIGELVVRRAVRDWDTGKVTVDVVGQEVLVDDKRRNAATTIDTGATNVTELVYWSLTDVFGTWTMLNDPITTSTSLPAGDRRLMLQGETHNDLIEPELTAIGCRLYDYWGREWHAVSRDTPPTYEDAPSLVKLATFTLVEGAPADADPIVFSITETVESGGDWADGVLVKGDYTDASGDRQTWYQASGAGANSRSRVITVNRAQPAANMADEIASRTMIRGNSVDITARIRFDVLPGMDLEVHTPVGVLTGIIRAVEWDTDETTMTIRAQTGEPVT